MPSGSEGSFRSRATDSRENGRDPSPRQGLTGPDFLGIGAPRSGTTWLYRHLGRHPQIWLPTLKELHYFDQRHRSRFRSRYYRAHLRKRIRHHLRRSSGRRGERGKLSWDLHYFTRRRSMSWYQRLFRPKSGQIAGEITPAYSMLRAGVVEEIRELNPDLKIIYLLRDPIERAWSGAVSELILRRGGSLESVPDSAFIRHFDHPGHILRGDYLRTLSIWERMFGRDQIFVGFLEEVQRSPRELLQRMFRFLEIDDDEALLSTRVARKINVAGDHRVSVPGRFERYLAGQYMPQLKVLAERYGDPPGTWLQRAERALGSASSPGLG